MIVLSAPAVKEEDQVKGKRIATPVGRAPDQGAFGKEIYAYFGEYLEKGDIRVRLMPPEDSTELSRVYIYSSL